LIIKDDFVNNLIDAGLTSQEAKVFLSLIQLQNASISRISKHSNLDRSNVYRTLKKLEEKEIVRKDIGKCIRFSSVPLPLAFDILISKKKMEYRTTLENLQRLLKQINFLEKSETKKDYFKIYPAGSQFFCRKWERTLTSINKNLDIIVTEYREPKNDKVLEIYEELFQKGVKLRWIIDRSSRNDNEFDLRVEQFEHLLKYPTLETKFSFKPQIPYGAICDNKFVVICLDPQPPIKCSRSLWTNNNQILLNFKQHFDVCWKNAISFARRACHNSGDKNT